jgi:rhamnose utilization protein RhaD (predicted bifunctional aldolase and dehydrogenase)/NAD(P)-dependent dehydrogenase (short-subunit alcohol dehydrogenase family)
MESLWDDGEAAQYDGDLALRVYTSRLLGRDKSLVMHGGGNTSVKITERNLLGDEEQLLYVKGSGWDLETIEAPGFSPVRLPHLLRLAQLDTLSDPQMVNELKTHMTHASAPTPSVEAILHAILPHRYVDHTHADAVITVTNTRDGAARIREIYGDTVVVIPYVMPGFDLARLCAREFAAHVHDGTVGMVLLNHGIFSFGATARESYERMIRLVSMAERYLARHGAWQLPTPAATPSLNSRRVELADLRRTLSARVGAPVLVAGHSDAKCRAFANHPEVNRLSQQGPATPDHVIRTKRLPLIGRDVDAYAKAYEGYFNTHAPSAKQPKTMLDPAPRVILDPAWGMLTVGRSAKDTAVVGDIYRHTMDIILRAATLGGYQALPAKDIFDVEYWDLEQAKLKQAGKPPPFSGEVVMITGAASGIGRACAEAFLAQGAAVIGVDIDPDIRTRHAERPGYRGVVCDVTDSEALESALEEGIAAFGGLDMAVLNAGVFPPGCRLEALDADEWRRVMQVNVDANVALMRLIHPLLKLAPRGGRVVVMGSKNVRAPGIGAAAYSASKAALNQLARVAALEWARDNIRVNTLHPNAVFDTGIWTEEVLQARAEHYGLTVEQYKTNNLLKTEVTSADVAVLAVALCGPAFAKTTGAQIPIDGGNERVI